MEFSGHGKIAGSSAGLETDKLRNMAGQGLGEIGALARLFETEPEDFEKPSPRHIMDVGDVVKGLGLTEDVQGKIKGLLEQTRTDFARRTGSQRLVGAKGLLLGYLRELKDVDFHVRREVARRADAYWRRRGADDMRLVIKADRHSYPGPRVVLTREQYLGKSTGSHKYTHREPDGKGGYRYYYAEDKASGRRGTPYVSHERLPDGSTHVKEHSSKKDAHEYGNERRAKGGDIAVHAKADAEKHTPESKRIRDASERDSTPHPNPPGTPQKFGSSNEGKIATGYVQVGKDSRLLDTPADKLEGKQYAGIRYGLEQSTEGRAVLARIDSQREALIEHHHGTTRGWEAASKHEREALASVHERMRTLVSAQAAAPVHTQKLHALMNEHDTFGKHGVVHMEHGKDESGQPTGISTLHFATTDHTKAGERALVNHREKVVEKLKAAGFRALKGQELRQHTYAGSNMTSGYSGGLRVIPEGHTIRDGKAVKESEVYAKQNAEAETAKAKQARDNAAAEVKIYSDSLKDYPADYDGHTLSAIKTGHEKYKQKYGEPIPGVQEALDAHAERGKKHKADQESAAEKRRGGAQLPREKLLAQLDTPEGKALNDKLAAQHKERLHRWMDQSKPTADEENKSKQQYAQDLQDGLHQMHYAAEAKKNERKPSEPPPLPKRESAKSPLPRSFDPNRPQYAGEPPAPSQRAAASTGDARGRQPLPRSFDPNRPQYAGEPPAAVKVAAPTDPTHEDHPERVAVRGGPKLSEGKLEEIRQTPAGQAWEKELKDDHAYRVQDARVANNEQARRKIIARSEDQFKRELYDGLHAIHHKGKAPSDPAIDAFLDTQKNKPSEPSKPKLTISRARADTPVGEKPKPKAYMGDLDRDVEVKTPAKKPKGGTGGGQQSFAFSRQPDGSLRKSRVFTVAELKALRA